VEAQKNFLSVLNAQEQRTLIGLLMRLAVQE
jgi:hypothetical protein